MLRQLLPMFWNMVNYLLHDQFNQQQLINGSKYILKNDFFIQKSSLSVTFKKASDFDFLFTVYLMLAISLKFKVGYSWYPHPGNSFNSYHLIKISQILHQLMTTLKKVVTTLCLLALSNAEPTLTSSESWGYGFLAGFCLSLLGFVAALVLICLQKCLTEGCFKIFVNLLYALACGAIVGDAMIHILPEAFTSQSVNIRYVSLIFICAIAFFMILERIFKALGIAHQHWGEEQHHHHDHEEKKDITEEEQGKRESTQNQKVDLAEIKIVTSKGNGDIKGNDIQTSQLCLPPSDAEIAGSNGQTPQKVQKKSDDSSKSSDEEKTCLENLRGKGAAGYLNLLSSFVHNFFDGFGIGVGFASGDTQIIVPIVIAIFAHEIPRQMGDVGILIKSGFSNIQTVLCNGFINFLSLIGVIAGLAIGSVSDQVQNYVMVFVAGNFIYIGADIWKHLLANDKLILNIGEILMFSIGVGAMFLVLLAEG